MSSTDGKRHIALDYRRKNRIKVYKTIVQTVILVCLAWLLVHSVFDIKKYEEPDKAGWSNKEGFIAISYFGLARTGSPNLIAKSRLDQHLQALYDQGYTTISQQDVLDFYNEGKPLPDKALFLSFEDGRNDSSLFSQPLLEKYNYKATMLSYAGKMGSKEQKFLQPKQLLGMTRNGYWELGSNGYRLAYINIYGKDGRYFEQLEEADFKDRKGVDIYNHYLMDFLRDEDGIPVENRSHMEKRINWDYDAIHDIYTEKLGFVPGVYMVMHANSLYNGMNRLVADVNSRNIHQLFTMHFNREGIAYNDSGDDLYNLTRVQPAPYWYTNHLLMKVFQDTGESVKYVIGDERRAEKWVTMGGVAEFDGNRIVLTSPPADKGMLYLKESDSFSDIRFTAKLAGNVVGNQSVYLRYDRNNDTFIRVSLIDNEVIVEQKVVGEDLVRIYPAPQDDAANSGQQLVQEADKANGQESNEGTGRETGQGTGRETGQGTERETGQETERETGQGTERETGQGSERETGQGSERETGQGSERETGQGAERETGQGAEQESVQGSGVEQEQYPINIQATRQVDITITGEQLTLVVDKELLADKLLVADSIEQGGIALQSAYSAANRHDTIYDGVFDDVAIVTAPADGSKSAQLYNNAYKGFAVVTNTLKKAVNAAMDWAIDTF
ncbi:polysaccharide deacetylase [Paenibacillaceae bacterium]|nr:polysaccharide deacetylase [Paenibacillaceae bacterium]